MIDFSGRPVSDVFLDVDLSGLAVSGLLDDSLALVSADLDAASDVIDSKCPDCSPGSDGSRVIGYSGPGFSGGFVISELLLLSEIMTEETCDYLLSSWIGRGETGVNLSALTLMSAGFDAASVVIDSGRLDASREFSELSHSVVPSQTNPASDIFPVSDSVMFTEDLQEALPLSLSLTPRPDCDSSVSTSHEGMTTIDSGSSLSWTTNSTSIFSSTGFSEPSSFRSFSPPMDGSRCTLSMSGCSDFGVSSQQVLTSDVFPVSNSLIFTHELERALLFPPSRTHHLDSGSSISSYDSDSSLSWTTGSTSIFSYSALPKRSDFVPCTSFAGSLSEPSLKMVPASFSAIWSNSLHVAVSSQGIPSSNVFPISNSVTFL
jgi:hypothetical protein